MMRRAAFGLVLASALPAAAEDPPLMCFGNEPSWSLALETPDRARLTLPDEAPAEYRGASTRIEPLRERVWRGKLESGAGGDLVAFLREADCSDGMSDVTHPVLVRVSLPDGRFRAGCCRITSSGAAAPPASAALEGPVWRLVQLRGQTETALAGLQNGVTIRFEAGRLRGFGGCNHLSGSYTIDRDRDPRSTRGNADGLRAAGDGDRDGVQGGLQRFVTRPRGRRPSDPGLGVGSGSGSETRLRSHSPTSPRGN
jgi:uncharacterized membrane protein